MMLRVKKILFPTDLSQCSQESMKYAIASAELFGAELHVLHVTVLFGTPSPEAMFVSPEEVNKQVEAIAESTMNELLEPLKEKPLEIIEARRREIAAGPAIVSYAKEHDIDLIVMGTHGRRGLKRFVIGSVAEEVVRNAPCSVVTLRAIGERSVNVYSDIVVPVDFSPFSRSALRTAVKLASLFDATIQLVHVINHLSLPSFYSPMYGAFEGEHMDKVRADSIELMKEWMEDHDVPFETHVRLGGTSEQIVSYVEELDAPMLVMATHGLTGLQHFLLGSTSEQVIRYSKCPVWTHKMYDKQLVPQEQALTGLLSPAS